MEGIVEITNGTAVCYPFKLRELSARDHAESAVRAGYEAELWKLYREVVELAACQALDALALTNVAKLRGLSEFFSGEGFAALPVAQRADGDLVAAIHDCQRAAEDDPVELVWVQYVTGVYLHRRDVLGGHKSGVPAGIAAQVVAALEVDHEDIAVLLLRRLREIGSRQEEDRCGCGATLAHVAGDGVTATLCLSCDQGAAALDDEALT
jgi:hypothetical protein